MFKLEKSGLLLDLSGPSGRVKIEGIRFKYQKKGDRHRRQKILPLPIPEIARSLFYKNIRPIQNTITFFFLIKNSPAIYGFFRFKGHFIAGVDPIYSPLSALSPLQVA
jgi:hypothetical protein